MLRDIETEMSSVGSFRVYRDSLKKTQSPCIPFMYAPRHSCAPL